ncbi:hypothetical protein [Chryseobacterium gwangjuense]|uniref:hypothetical protein n=1 Tax=Chryseobacterium gwangjuense TaxID=1069980 RepID=UPI001E3F0626|nr:hypothetical protein [Chryseobacterium gwangjuense]MCE3074666.1 hypothetical protein [Chryseobacterium gwangjuense]
MKRLLFLFTLSFSFLHSQEISRDEYILYAQILDHYNYSFNKFELGIPIKYEGLLNGPKNTSKSKIAKIKSKKKFNASILEGVLLKYRKDKNLDRENFPDPVKNYKEEIYCSPIYFKTNTEAFIFVVTINKLLPHPSHDLIKATREEDGYWCLEDYNYYYN